MKVLTRCQSGRWSTLGGRGRLDPSAPCNHAVKMRKKSVRRPLVAFCLNFYLWLLKVVLIVPFFASRLCLHLLPLCNASARAHCPLHSHVSPAAPDCLWAPVCCGCSVLAVTRVSELDNPSWLLSHSIWMALPGNTLFTADWLFSGPMRAQLLPRQVIVTGCLRAILDTLVGAQVQIYQCFRVILYIIYHILLN